MKKGLICFSNIKNYFGSRRILNSNNTNNDGFSFKLSISIRISEMLVSRVVSTSVTFKDTALFLVAKSEGSKTFFSHMVDFFQKLLLGVIVKRSNSSVSEQNLRRVLDQIIRGTLDEHNSLAGGLVFGDDGHALSVTSEFESGNLVEIPADVFTVDFSVTSSQNSIIVSLELFNQNLKGSFGGETRTSVLVEVLDELGIVIKTHAFNETSEGSVSVNIPLLDIGNISFGLIGDTRDIRSEEIGSVVTVEDELLDNHFVGGQSTGLIRANDSGATEGFNTLELSDNSSFLGHTTGSQSQAGGDDSGQTFRDSSDGKSDGDLEVVQAASDETTVDGIAEVSEVDNPDDDANDTDSLGQSFTEFFETLFQGSVFVFGFLEILVDLTNFSVGTSGDDNTDSITTGDEGTAENDIVLFTDGGLLVGDGVEGLQDGLGFSGQDRLFDTDGGSLDFDESDISGDLVTLLDLKSLGQNYKSFLVLGRYRRGRHLWRERGSRLRL